jgi:hypothetical protein
VLMSFTYLHATLVHIWLGRHQLKCFYINANAVNSSLQEGIVMGAQKETEEVVKREKAGMDHECPWLRNVAQ